MLINAYSLRARMHYQELIALLHGAVAASCRTGVFLPAGSLTLAGTVTQQLARATTVPNRQKYRHLSLV